MPFVTFLEDGLV